MGSPYSGSDDFPTSITIPDDGEDPRDAAAVNTPFEGTINRTTWLKNRIGEMRVVTRQYLPIAAGGALARNNTNSFTTAAENATPIVGHTDEQSVKLYDTVDVFVLFHGSTNFVGSGHIVYDLFCGVYDGGVNYGTSESFIEVAGFQGNLTPLMIYTQYNVPRDGFLTLSLRARWSSVPGGGEYVYVNSPLYAQWTQWRTNV